MQLNINVANKIATLTDADAKIICNNSDYEVAFTFDDEWAGYGEKTARFVWNGKYKDVKFTGNTCPVPIVRGTNMLFVGVYAGELCTTTSAGIPCLRSILDMANDEQTEKAAAGGFKIVGTFETECCDESGFQTFLGEPYEWYQKYNDEGAGGKWFMIDSSNALVEESLVYNIKANYDDQNPLDELFRTSTFVVLNFIGIAASYGDRDEDYKEVTGGLIPLHIWENFQIGRFDDILPIVEERIGNPLHTCLVEVHDYEGGTHHCLYLSDFVTSTLALAHGDGIQLSLRFTGYSDKA